MKALLLFALLAGFDAQARTPLFHQTEILPHVEINGQKTSHTAVVHIDFHGNSIKAEIFNDNCGSLTAQPGMITCLAMPRLVETIEAPLTEKGSSCGSAVFKGFTSDSIRDGLQVKIIAFDHSHRVCRDLVRSVFEVKASVFNPWTHVKNEYYLSK